MATGEASGGRDPDGVSLLVCVLCGRGYDDDGGETPPEDFRCDRCGGEVFRRFDDTTSSDEARAEFHEETDRDLATDDPAGDVAPGDLHDLNP